MHQQFTNIALISDNTQRIKQLSELLRGSENKVIPYTFDAALQRVLLDERQDLVVLDCPSNPEFDYRQLNPLRNQQILKYVPFIFIVTHKQETLKKQIYHNPQNKILIEPLDKFSFISAIGNALYASHLERRLLIYKDLVEGEKKLISNMDKLLEFNRLQQFPDESQVFDFIRSDFCRRLELTLAVETAFYGQYQSKDKIIEISSDVSDGAASKEEPFLIKTENSIVWEQINKNFPFIFENESLTDPFIQRLEEFLGFKITGLLFVPITVLHQTQGVIILINKLYRNEFTENDLAFSLISSQKIIFHLEKIHLNLDKQESRLLANSAYSEKSQILSEWKMYKHIMNSVHFGAIVITKDYIIQYINKAAREILHISTSQEADISLQTILSDYQFEEMREKLDAGELPLVRQEMHIIHPERKEKFYLGYSIYPFSTDGKNEEYILVFSEISQTKRIQAEIIRMDRMASLGILSAGIAHEIRNPLAGIKAMAQTLEEDLGDDSARTEYVVRIIRQVNRLDDLLKAFFSYTNPHPPEPKPIQVHKIIKNVMPLFERRLRYDDITIQQNYAKDLYEVFVDDNQIEQVFLNFFLNAFEAIGKSGKIEVTAQNATEPQPVVDRRNRMSNSLSTRFIQISIKDSGMGMRPDVRDKIFDPFFTTKANGTGLGLSIVYQIIREHGGQIEVLSEKNKGTEFIIMLPAYVKKRQSGR